MTIHDLRGGQIQTTDTVLMVRPARFFSNPETAATNAFQSAGASRCTNALLAQAQKEFDEFAELLKRHDVVVLVVDDTAEPVTPDAVYPNNWISFHADGTVVLYPMMAASRRAEVRMELVECLRERGLFQHRRTVDLRHLENSDQFLEGTGSLVLDRPNHIAYACLSPRTRPQALAEFGQRLGYRVFAFEARDTRGVPIYHTNVLMCVGDRFAVACLEAVSDPKDRKELADSLRKTGHELVEISLAQLESFAGNCLALRSKAGAPLIVMSTRARGCLSAAQRSVLERHGRIVAAELSTIETHGGGSARCMLAEVFSA